MAARRVRARRGSGSIQLRAGQLPAQVSLGPDAFCRRIRRAKSFDSRTQAAACIAPQQHDHHQLADPVTEHRLADHLRW